MIYRLLIILIISASQSACTDEATSTPENTVISNAVIEVPAAQQADTENQTFSPEPIPHIKPQKQFNIGNKRYLFDVSTHSVDDLKSLLTRIEEITEVSPEAFDQLEIVMVLHGPDIDLFTEKNYTENKHLVDLAKKLDAIQLVDMKVCETAMNGLGVEKDEIPEFIELVPYAPDTLKQLEREGFINL